MHSVSERLHPQTWTCKIVPRGGRLLDLGAITRAVQGVGDSFLVRGFEATVAGWLLRRGQEVVLRIGGSGQELRLQPLRHKVQWDRARGRPQDATPREREALHRLLASWQGGPRRVVITGPLVDNAAGRLPDLEVRQYRKLL